MYRVYHTSLSHIIDLNYSGNKKMVITFVGLDNGTHSLCRYVLGLNWPKAPYTLLFCVRQICTLVYTAIHTCICIIFNLLDKVRGGMSISMSMSENERKR